MGLLIFLWQIKIKIVLSTNTLLSFEITDAVNKYTLLDTQETTEIMLNAIEELKKHLQECQYQVGEEDILELECDGRYVWVRLGSQHIISHMVLQDLMPDYYNYFSSGNQSNLFLLKVISSKYLTE